MRHLILISSLLAILFAGCVAEEQDMMVASTSTATPDSRPNILLIIGDDMGNETLSCYGLNDNAAKTPTLDDLCAQGVRFDNFWSQPTCSPTRATMLTGRYGFRTGVGTGRTARTGRAASARRGTDRLGPAAERIHAAAGIQG